MQRARPQARCLVAATAHNPRELEDAPARFLDEAEELRMGLTDEQLIAAAVECNHAAIGPTTARALPGPLGPLRQYLASAHHSDFYRAGKMQGRLFMGYLERPGGAHPDPARTRCEWCPGARLPRRPQGPRLVGPLPRELSLGAALPLPPLSEPTTNYPTVLESSPRVIVRRVYTPGRAEIERLLAADGPPRSVLLVHWLSYALAPGGLRRGPLA